MKKKEEFGCKLFNKWKCDELSLWFKKDEYGWYCDGLYKKTNKIIEYLKVS